MDKDMKIERKWAMPNKWTFTIKPIAELIKDEVGDGIWLDPFAGMNSPATKRNDINPEMDAQDHMDAIEWLKIQPDNSADGILLDPPYSNRQISEHYKSVGMKVTGWHTSSGWGATLKNEATRVLKTGGKCICFGWNSMGIGKTRGFEMTRVLLVPHGGSKNDTIITVEIKI